MTMSVLRPIPPMPLAESWDVTDDLEVAHRSLRWTLLSKKDRAWLIQVFDQAGELLDSGMGDNEDDALLGVIEFLRPPKSPD